MIIFYSEVLCNVRDKKEEETFTQTQEESDEGFLPDDLTFKTREGKGERPSVSHSLCTQTQLSRQPPSPLWVWQRDTELQAESELTFSVPIFVEMC